MRCGQGRGGVTGKVGNGDGGVLSIGRDGRQIWGGREEEVGMGKEHTDREGYTGKCKNGGRRGGRERGRE